MDVTDAGTARVAGAGRAGGKHADVCNGGGDDRGSGRWGLGGCRGGWSTCADTRGGGGGAFLGRVLRQAAAFVAIATSAGAAVRLDIFAPACEFETLERFWPGIGEKAISDLE